MQVQRCDKGIDDAFVQVFATTSSESKAFAATLVGNGIYTASIPTSTSSQTAMQVQDICNSFSTPLSKVCDLASPLVANPLAGSTVCAAVAGAIDIITLGAGVPESPAVFAGCNLALKVAVAGCLVLTGGPSDIGGTPLTPPDAPNLLSGSAFSICDNIAAVVDTALSSNMVLLSARATIPGLGTKDSSSQTVSASGPFPMLAISASDLGLGCGTVTVTHPSTASSAASYRITLGGKVLGVTPLLNGGQSAMFTFPLEDVSNSGSTFVIALVSSTNPFAVAASYTVDLSSSTAITLSFAGGLTTHSGYLTKPTHPSDTFTITRS